MRSIAPGTFMAQQRCDRAGACCLSRPMVWTAPDQTVERGLGCCARFCYDRDYSVKPKFSMWRLSVGVMIDPVTFLFIR